MSRPGWDLYRAAVNLSGPQAGALTADFMRFLLGVRDQAVTGTVGVQGEAGATGATGPGVAAGGASGQVLAKTSATDYATGWITPDTETETYTTTATVSSPRVVVTSNTSAGVKQADNSVATDGSRVVGISVTAALSGGTITVRRSGVLTDNSLSLDVTKRVFCDTDGRLTQTPPSTGWIRCVGSPITATSMLVDLNMPIFRP